MKMVVVTLHSRFTEAYSRFLDDNKVPALISMCGDETTFTMSADNEMRIRGLWNVKDYAEYIWN
jgi:hypothetical protein